ncbi:MAG: hypothetical protein LBG82_01160 [Clostridiales Family XIII bacterium]|jgi:hypothetical protein|nr:hypothetical protein [Clostridiales Family XIII bacterium]
MNEQMNEQTNMGGQQGATGAEQYTSPEVNIGSPSGAGQYAPPEVNTGSPSGAEQYAPPEVNLHAGYAPPARTAPAGGATDGKLTVIIILLICILAVNAASFATGFVRNTRVMNPGAANGSFAPPTAQGQSAPNFQQDTDGES